MSALSIKAALAAMRAAGWHHDTRKLLSLYAQSSASATAAFDAFEAGVEDRDAGRACPCPGCANKSLAGAA